MYAVHPYRSMPDFHDHVITVTAVRHKLWGELNIIAHYPINAGISPGTAIQL